MSNEESKSKGRIPVDPDFFLFGVPIAVFSALAAVWSLEWIWITGIVALVGLAAFFRDPPRRGSQTPGAIRSPADGKVVEIEPNTDPDCGPVPGTKIGIFLSVLDCHINRCPAEAEVRSIRYERGKFLDARNPDSGKLNESNWIFMKSGEHEITVRQITGLIARRIVCRVREGQQLARGQRIGLIRFGSRTELYLPEQAEILVQVGQKVRGAETDVAILKDSSD